MTNNFKNVLTALFISWLATSCNSAVEEKPAAETRLDTIVTVSDPSPVEMPIMLKDAVLNEKSLVGNNRLRASTKIDKDAYKTLSIKVIDSTAADAGSFKYHIVDTLFSKPGLKILLIGRSYESENFVWIAIYDDQNKLIDNRAVYYDNAEGFMSVETVIKNNQLAITSFNEYAEQEKEKKVTAIYHLNESNKIIKL